tara:strand:- start:1756 stop:2559 length:804 start_codon:yes stop_codon:yes gene_type:complete
MLIQLIGVLALVLVISRVVVKTIDSHAEKTRINTARELNQQDSQFCSLQTLTESIPRDLIPPTVFRTALQQQTAIARRVMSLPDSPAFWAKRYTKAKGIEQMYRQGKHAPGPALYELSKRDTARLCQEALLRNVRLITSILPASATQIMSDLNAMAVTARFRVPAEHHYQQGVQAFSKHLPKEASFHFRMAREKLAGIGVSPIAEWHEALSRKITLNTERLAQLQVGTQKSRLESETEEMLSWHKPTQYDDSTSKENMSQHKAGVSS